MRSKNKKKIWGFTLVELMIVVAVIGILAGIAVPRYMDFVTRAKEGATKGNLGAIRSAVNIYYADNAFYPLIISIDPAFPVRLYWADGFGWEAHPDFKEYMWDIPLCRVGPEPSGAQHTRYDVWHQGIQWPDTVPTPGAPDVGWWYFRSTNTVSGICEIGRVYCNAQGMDKKGTLYISW
jgi:prepilin-type N-terminal cleavage/methylation domain-containing protein